MSMVERVNHDREILVQKVIMAISSASVPHKGSVLGSIESRCLGYYLELGIDVFDHDHARHEALLRKAAEQAIDAALGKEVS